MVGLGVLVGTGVDMGLGFDVATGTLVGATVCWPVGTCVGEGVIMEQSSVSPGADAISLKVITANVPVPVLPVLVLPVNFIVFPVSVPVALLKKFPLVVLTYCKNWVL